MAGLEAVDPDPHLDQRIAVLLADLVPGELRLREHRIVFGELRDQEPRHRRQVARRRILVRVRQAGGIDEMRVGEPDLLGELVHHARELGFGAAQPLGQRDCRVVAGLDDHRAQQVAHLHLGIELGKHGRAARCGTAVAPGVLGDEEFVVQRQPALLDLVEHDSDRHEFGHAGRLERLVAVLVEEQRAGLVVHQHRELRLGLEILRHGSGGRQRERCKQPGKSEANTRHWTPPVAARRRP